MAEYHLAQINIARAVDELDSDTMAGFVARIDEINALAEQSPGFVWRLQTDEGDSLALRVFDDPLLIINMSVWQDMASLKDYVFKSTHLELLRNKTAWFNKMESAHLAMWWIPAGYEPSIEDGKQRLEIIQAQGPGPEAFTFSRPWPAPE